MSHCKQLNNFCGHIIELRCGAIRYSETSNWEQRKRNVLVPWFTWTNVWCRDPSRLCQISPVDGFCALRIPVGFLYHPSSSQQLAAEPSRLPVPASGTLCWKKSRRRSHRWSFADAFKAWLFWKSFPDITVWLTLTSLTFLFHFANLEVALLLRYSDDDDDAYAMSWNYQINGHNSVILCTLKITDYEDNFSTETYESHGYQFRVQIWHILRFCGGYDSIKCSTVFCLKQYNSCLRHCCTKRRQTTSTPDSVSDHHSPPVFLRPPTSDRPAFSHSFPLPVSSGLLTAWLLAYNSMQRQIQQQKQLTTQKWQHCD